ncbi:MAG: peptidoglycan bridge formation glycyltransferase FemA/FemB family protein [Candidatus Dormibacteraeota bacterium]|nr:peptidoglycan bridge formation glycyltransferase FemA/FemB family protein [Candidatus Dormibacteraeota bacterium]
MITNHTIGAGRLVACTDPTTWDAFVSAASDGSILQSWSWGELKERYGWEPTRYLWIRDGSVRGAVSVLRKPLPGGLAMHYAPRGPVLNKHFAEWPQLWAALRRRLALQGGTVLKVDPEWPAESGYVLQFTNARPSHSVQHQATALIDLRDGEAVFERMSASARRNMRQAERAGVVIESSDQVDAVDRFYDMLAATADRQEFTIRPRSYYRDLFTVFSRPSNFPDPEHFSLPGSRGQGRVGARVYLATHRGVTVAGSVIVNYGDRLIYLFSGSSDEGRRLKAPYLIQQRVIRDGQARGSQSYDLWGIPVDPQPGDPGWGYAHFKTMLGGVPVRFAGAWDLPVYRPLAAAYHLAERVLARPAVAV